MEENCVSNWKEDEVLEKLRVEQFDALVIEAFQREAIDGPALLALTCEDMKDMQLKLGHRKKLEQLIKSLLQSTIGRTEPEPLSLVSTTPGSMSTTVTSQVAIHQASTCTDSTSQTAPSQTAPSQTAPSQTAPSQTAPSQTAPSQIVTPQASTSQATTFYINRYTSKTMFDIIQMLTASEQGKDLYEDYLSRDVKLFSVPERRTLVVLITQALIKQCGIFPTTIEKETLAEALVAAFPSLGFKEGERIVHSHFYHKKSGGFIETALKTIRNGQPECRKRKRNEQKRPHRKIPPGLCTEVMELSTQELETLEFKVRFMKSLPPSASNIKQITDEMEATYEYRQKQLSTTHKDPTLLLQEYPRMVDCCNGRLIFDDFMRKYPSAQDIEHGFIQYRNSLEQLAAIEGIPSPSCNDEFLRMLMTCIQIMPEIRKIRRSSEETKLQQLVVFLPENRDMEEFVKGRPKNMHQPFLLCSGSSVDPLFFNVVIEETIIPCGIKSSSAFKILFSSFFVFQLHYPTLIKPLYKFFEERIFKISKTVSATTAEFMSRLQTIRCVG